MRSLRRISCLAVGLLACLAFVGCERKSSLPEEKEYFSKDSKPTAKEVIKLCRDLGFGSAADQLEKGLLPCFRLAPCTGTPSRVCSKIGGLPTLPDPLLWPKHQEKSLSFIAQINLQELPGNLPKEILPQKGMLYFFYDAKQATWGYDPKDKGSWRVIYAENLPEGVQVVSSPADIPEEARFKEKLVQLQDDFSLPEPSEALNNASLSDEQEDAVYEIYDQFKERRSPWHQLLGHADPIQGDMKLECQLVSHGLYCGDGTGYNDPKAKVLAPGAAQWRLLLQIDTEEDLGMMWGDSGRLYFWITEDDLRNKRFENVWMISQCY
jgi:uncharacterized protein YwqG